MRVQCTARKKNTKGQKGVVPRAELASVENICFTHVEIDFNSTLSR